MPNTNPKPPADAVRSRDLRRDPRMVLRGALTKPIRVSAKEGGRLYHVATIRRGDRKDPARAGALPITVAALEDRAGRILTLAGALQIALKVQLTPTSLDAFFIEPDTESLAFTAARLGGLGASAAMLRAAIRQGPVARAAADAAAKRADARRRREVAALGGKIAALEQAAKRGTDLAADLKKTGSALQEARKETKAAESAATKMIQERDGEIQALKTRVVSLERALKRQAAGRELNGAAAVPAPELPPPAPSEA